LKYSFEGKARLLSNRRYRPKAGVAPANPLTKIRNRRDASGLSGRHRIDPIAHQLADAKLDSITVTERQFTDSAYTAGQLAA